MRRRQTPKQKQPEGVSSSPARTPIISQPTFSPPICFSLKLLGFLSFCRVVAIVVVAVVLVEGVVVVVGVKQTTPAPSLVPQLSLLLCLHSSSLPSLPEQSTSSMMKLSGTRPNRDLLVACPPVKPRLLGGKGITN